MTKLLVVDDDPDITEALTSILTLNEFEVIVASNGLEGLHVLDTTTPDVVLLDVEMPILDGPNMVYRMIITNAGRERIPVILLSGVANLKSLAERVGTPYFLRKPYRIQALFEVLHRALTERQAPHPDEHIATDLF
jgi:DNA-binding NtrC family response regulator